MERVWKSTTGAPGYRYVSRAFALLLAIALIAPAVAFAADEPEVEASRDLATRVKEHEALAGVHKREKAYEALLEDIRTAIELFEEAGELEDERKGEKLRERLVKLVGGLTKMRDDDIALAAVEGLGTMKHEDGVKYLKPHLKPIDDRTVPKIVTAAMEAAGEIGNDKVVPALLKMVDKSDNYKVAAKAMEVLGNFGHSRRYRGKILEELGGSIRLMSRPEGGTRCQIRIPVSREPLPPPTHRKLRT